MLVKIRKTYSFERMVMQEILAACDNGTPVDRKTIIRQASKKYIRKSGKKPSNPGGYFRNLWHVLTTLRRYNPFGFERWFQSTGLNRYLAEYSGTCDYLQITFDAILNAKTQKDLLTNPDLFFEQVTRKIRGNPGPFSLSDLQTARQSKLIFFALSLRWTHGAARNGYCFAHLSLSLTRRISNLSIKRMGTGESGRKKPRPKTSRWYGAAASGEK